MQLNPHLHFAGQCEEAFQFYAQALGGKINLMLTYGETSAAGHVAGDWRSKIIHATMIVGEKTLMGCDPPPDRYSAPKGFSVALGADDPAEVERIYNALAADATIIMPMQETFWSVRFGMLVDRFGIPWMINCGQPKPS